MAVLIKGMEMPFDHANKTIVICQDGTVLTRRGEKLPYEAVYVEDEPEDSELT